MTASCSGADFLRFYNDKAWWFSTKDGTASRERETCWDEASIFVNDKKIAEYEYDFENDLNPGDTVKVIGGVVLGKVVGRSEPSLEVYLKRWLKAQSSTTVLIECQKEQLDAILAAVKAAGGRVLI